jgi:hypothetical protein
VLDVDEWIEVSHVVVLEVDEYTEVSHVVVHVV